MTKYECKFFNAEYNGRTISQVNLFGIFSPDGQPVKVCHVSPFKSRGTERGLDKITYVENLLDGELNLEWRAALHSYAAELTKNLYEERQLE